MITACGSILGCSYAEGCRRKVRVLGTVLGGPKSRCADAGNLRGGSTSPHGTRAPLGTPGPGARCRVQESAEPLAPQTPGQFWCQESQLSRRWTGVLWAGQTDHSEFSICLFNIFFNRGKIHVT